MAVAGVAELEGDAQAQLVLVLVHRETRSRSEDASEVKRGGVYFPGDVSERKVLRDATGDERLRLLDQTEMVCARALANRARLAAVQAQIDADGIRDELVESLLHL